MPKYKKITRIILSINFNKEIEITNNTIQADVGTLSEAQIESLLFRKLEYLFSIQNSIP